MRTRSGKYVRAVAVAGATAALALGGMTSASAAADTAEGRAAGTTLGTPISTFHPVAPVSLDRFRQFSDGHLEGGSPGPQPVYDGICWAEGRHVDDGNFAHDKWVKVSNPEGAVHSGDHWVWAGALVGNETGNVPNHC